MFRLSTEAIETGPLLDSLRAAEAGACATFEGWVRNHNEGREVQELEYEGYEAVAASEGEKVVAEALEKFDVHRVECVHRVGRLAIGDMAVWVGVSASHRAASFDACRYVIEEVKKRLPIWKKEHYVDGDSGWINCETGAARSGKS